MVLMCKTISDYPTAEGAMPLLFSVRDCVPLAFPALMFAIFFILLASQYFLIKGRTGRPKAFVALMSSSFVCTILSLILALAQLVKFNIVILYAFIAITSFIFLAISDES